LSTRSKDDELLGAFLAAVVCVRVSLDADRVASLGRDRLLAADDVRGAVDARDAAQRLVRVLSPVDDVEAWLRDRFESVGYGDGGDPVAAAQLRWSPPIVDRIQEGASAMLRARFGAPDLERLWAPRDT
jgi:hypothetical protein